MSIHLEQMLADLLNTPASAPSGPVLWIADESLTERELLVARARPDLYVLTNRHDLGARLNAAGLQVTVSDFDFTSLPVQQFATVVYRVSKERPLVHHCINESYRHLLADGALHLLGSKDDGIRTHGRNAEQVFGTPEHAKKQGDVYRVSLLRGHETGDEGVQWLDCKEYSHLRPCTVGELHFISKPGVFGWNKVDRGSVLLVEEAHKLITHRKNAGTVLDLGCGYGYLLLATADIPFSGRWATDNNAAAVQAAQASFARAQLAVHVSLDDCGEQLQERFDLILCNPPFHQGFSTSNALAVKFLTQIRRLLAPNGRALVVVNQFIALEKAAEESFSKITTLTQAQGFKVVQLG